ncbi:MAG: cation diffusion facilitator family transporter [Lachnospiraceae bacterium]|nr:cation diffusion facilitator family transporter [Lachnospiraceae bacterium]
MIKLLSRLLISNHKSYEDPQVRRKYGVLTGIIGICFNILLFGLKYFAGVWSGSVAMIADAFNNLSDAGSSIITMIGFLFSGREPDAEHPFGHGRYEYIAGFLVSQAILLMGLELAKGSFEKILHPQVVETSGMVYFILVFSILVKCYMAVYNHAIGKRIRSAAMHATAMDSLSDMAATSVVLLSMMVLQQTSYNIDGYCGLLVAVFILYTGVQTIRETMGTLLGTKPDADFVDQVQDIVLRHHLVMGMHDLVVHDYGAGRRMISLHLEVPGEMDVYALHNIIEHIESDLDQELGCKSVIHMDPIESGNEKVMELRLAVQELVQELDACLSIHDFRMVRCHQGENMVFDLVLPQEFSMTGEEVVEQLTDHLRERYPAYEVVIKLEQNYI